jgi:hypothetical protein
MLMMITRGLLAETGERIQTATATAEDQETPATETKAQIEKENGTVDAPAHQRIPADADEAATENEIEAEIASTETEIATAGGIAKTGAPSADTAERTTGKTMIANANMREEQARSGETGLFLPKAMPGRSQRAKSRRSQRRSQILETLVH